VVSEGLGGDLECLVTIMKYLKIPSQELAAQLVLRLIDEGEATAADLAGKLGASYPLVLRVVGELERVGLIESSKLKGKGRGRPKKLIRLNRDKLIETISMCEERAKKLRERLGGS